MILNFVNNVCPMIIAYYYWVKTLIDFIVDGAKILISYLMLKPTKKKNGRKSINTTPIKFSKMAQVLGFKKKKSQK